MGVGESVELDPGVGVGEAESLEDAEQRAALVAFVLAFARIDATGQLALAPFSAVRSGYLSPLWPGRLDLE